MTPWIFDRRAMLAGALALTAVVIAFVGAFWWLQTRMMAVHVRETYSLLDQDLSLRQRLGELLGRQTLTQTLEVRRAVLPEAPEFVLLDSKPCPAGVRCCRRPHCACRSPTRTVPAAMSWRAASMTARR
jgi:hypothetical protein